MKIKKRDDVPMTDTPGYAGVTKRSSGTRGRLGGDRAAVLQRGQRWHDPLPRPRFSPLVGVEAGRGVTVDANKGRTPVAAGDYVYVRPDEVHCFTNTGDEPLEFICIVPIRGEVIGAPIVPAG